MTKSIKGAAHLHTEKRETVITSDGTLIQSVTTNDLSVFVEAVQQSKKHCYMIGVNGRNKKKLNDIVAFLFEHKMLTNVFSGIDASRLFLSPANLIPLQKKIAENFKNLKFVLVRLNRSGFPKQRYC